MPKKKIILGIDPGYGITGYGVLAQDGSQLTCLDYGVITTEKEIDFSKRLKEIYQDLNTIIKKYKPSCVCIEELFFCKNVTTAIKVGQARGIVILSAVNADIPICEFTPLQIKQAVTGNGRADKKQIQQMVKMLLRLDKLPQPDDAADALAIAICGANSLKLKK